jgi:hypothetical protein
VRRHPRQRRRVGVFRSAACPRSRDDDDAKIAALPGARSPLNWHRRLALIAATLSGASLTVLVRLKSARDLLGPPDRLD